MVTKEAGLNIGNYSNFQNFNNCNIRFGTRKDRNLKQELALEFIKLQTPVTSCALPGETPQLWQGPSLLRGTKLAGEESQKGAPV